MSVARLLAVHPAPFDTFSARGSRSNMDMPVLQRVMQAMQNGVTADDMAADESESVLRSSQDSADFADECEDVNGQPGNLRAAAA